MNNGNIGLGRCKSGMTSNINVERNAMAKALGIIVTLAKRDIGHSHDITQIVNLNYNQGCVAIEVSKII